MPESICHYPQLVRHLTLFTGTAIIPLESCFPMDRLGISPLGLGRGRALVLPEVKLLRLNELLHVPHFSTDYHYYQHDGGFASREANEV